MRFDVRVGPLGSGRRRDLSDKDSQLNNRVDRCSAQAPCRARRKRAGLAATAEAGRHQDEFDGMAAVRSRHVRGGGFGIRRLLVGGMPARRHRMMPHPSMGSGVALLPGVVRMFRRGRGRFSKRAMRSDDNLDLTPRGSDIRALAFEPGGRQIGDKAGQRNDRSHEGGETKHVQSLPRPAVSL